MCRGRGGGGGDGGGGGVGGYHIYYIFLYYLGGEVLNCRKANAYAVLDSYNAM